MKKKIITLGLSAVMIISSYSIAFADVASIITEAADGTISVTEVNCLAEREGNSQIITPFASNKITADKTTHKTPDSTAITGYSYSGSGWVKITNGGDGVYHSTTVTMEFRTGSGNADVYVIGDKKWGTGKVSATCGGTQTPSSAYVYYDF